MTTPVLSVRNLVKSFPVRGSGLARQQVKAVQDVSFDLLPGTTLGLVGESGCGKSTVGRCIAQFIEPTSGSILFDGTDVVHLSKRDRRAARTAVQLVFQDPYGSLDPRVTIGDTIAEPLLLEGRSGRDARAEADSLLDRIGLSSAMRTRYPHEFSGGQRQRIAIARALATRPRVLVLDEPVSALDVSVQAQIIGMLQDLQTELGLSYLFISHDLSVVHHLVDQVAVMYLGRIVELGSKDEVFAAPLHPYSKALMSAVPVPDPALRSSRERIVLSGEVPSPVHPPSGCSFHARCWRATEFCATAVPALDVAQRDHQRAACFIPLDPAALASAHDTGVPS